VSTTYEQDSQTVEQDDLDLFIAEQATKGRGFANAYQDAEHRAGLLRCLVTLRRTSKLSQAEVARSMGTTQSAVSELEGGGRDFYLSTLQRYARALSAKIEIFASSDQAILLPETMRPFFRQPGVPASRLSFAASRSRAARPMYLMQEVA
jgi:transcriptional regulator with XRE-family HTH domain